MNFKIEKRKISCISEGMIGYNRDYVAEFVFDEEWGGKIKTARFIMDKDYFDVILKNDTCIIPEKMVKQGFLKVGVYSDEMTTTYCEEYIYPSIKDMHGFAYAPAPDIYEQIIRLIENMESVGVTPEQIREAVNAYMEENPLEEQDPTVPEWAKQPKKPFYTANEVGAATEEYVDKQISIINGSELFDKTKLVDPAKRNSFITIDGVEYYRYHASADNFEYPIQNPKPGSVTIKCRFIPQYGDGTAKTGIFAVYSDGTDARICYQPDVVNAFTTPQDKTLTKIRGNYDMENWVLLDMSVMSIKTMPQKISDKLDKNQGSENKGKTMTVGPDGGLIPQMPPEKLPNPQKLIFTGAVTAEYDGSGAVTVTIPDGSGGTGGIQRIEKDSTDTVAELQPNILYIFPEMSTLTYTLAAGTEGVVNEYHFIFQSGATPTEVVHPAGVKIGSLTVEANKIYEISVMENCLTSQSWAVTI